MSLLDTFLKKITGTSNIKELTAEEQETAKLWEQALSGKPITIDELRKFLETQVETTDVEWSKWDNSPTKDLFLKVYIRFCRLLLSYIERPEKVKKFKEKEIEERIKTESK